MSLFRVLLLWAIGFAVPFQAYAAVSMTICAGGQGQPTARVEPRIAAPSDHGEHHHAAAQPDSPPANQAHPHDKSHDGDPGHPCGTCGACHAVALTGSPGAIASDGLAPTALAEPLVALSTRPLRVLDRPPRA